VQVAVSGRLGERLVVEVGDGAGRAARAESEVVLQVGCCCCCCFECVVIVIVLL